MPVMQQHNLGDVWTRSGGLANGVLDPSRLGWMTPAERVRAERLRQARLLFEGQHRRYYVDEARSSHPFSSLRQHEPPYFRPYNLLTLVAEKMSDLLFGESPRLYIDNESAQQVIEGIAERSWLAAMLIDASAEGCWAGETYLEISGQGLDAYIAHVPADQMWPQGAAGPNHQHAEYIRYATAEVREGADPVQLLLETHYTAGRIERRLYKLAATDMSGPKRSAQVADLAMWPGRKADGQPLDAQVATGLRQPSIVRVPNGFGARSDYDGLIELQDSLHAANTQIGRVLAKHADPRLAAPEAMADRDTGNMPAAAEVFFFRNKDELPQYITWNAELASAMEDRKFALSALATVSEMPLSLLGIKDDSAVESAAKMRLASAPALAKAQRKAVIWRQAIAMAIGLAYELQTDSLLPETLGVEMRDGLPDDETERANTIALLRSAGSMSRKRSLQMQWLDPGTVRDEQQELDQESARQTPSVLFGEPGEGAER